MDLKTVCLSKKKECLGIRHIKMHNYALLGKCLWRFALERNSLWRKVIMAKYGCTLVWVPRDTRGTHGIGLWKSILKVKNRFRDFIRFHLGSGDDVQF